MACDTFGKIYKDIRSNPQRRVMRTVQWKQRDALRISPANKCIQDKTTVIGECRPHLLNSLTIKKTSSASRARRVRIAAGKGIYTPERTKMIGRNISSSTWVWHVFSSWNLDMLHSTPSHCMIALSRVMLRKLQQRRVLGTRFFKDIEGVIAGNFTHHYHRRTTQVCMSLVEVLQQLRTTGLFN